MVSNHVVGSCAVCVVSIVDPKARAPPCGIDWRSHGQRWNRRRGSLLSSTAPMKTSSRTSTAKTTGWYSLARPAMGERGGPSCRQATNDRAPFRRVQYMARAGTDSVQSGINKLFRFLVVIFRFWLWEFAVCVVISLLELWSLWK